MRASGATHRENSSSSISACSAPPSTASAWLVVLTMRAGRNARTASRRRWPTALASASPMRGFFSSKPRSFPPMQVHSGLLAAGATDSGLQREINEDRYHYDPVRGVFIVVDGVGGQAAGEKAAETALATIRTRLERETGPVADRVRESIALANDEIYRLASLQPQWKGMACVVTVAVVTNGDMILGHVGDSRLYKLRGGRIEKLTRDHSPVGEREDAGELSELDAMQHPRRNEVYRDVGSERHAPDDSQFIDVFRQPFETDAALLLCSDGLTDLITSAAIAGIVSDFAGHPFEIVRALIEAANAAGGKDNVTVVYAEGPRFAQGEDTRDLRHLRVAAEPEAQVSPTPTVGPAVRIRNTGRWRMAILSMLLVIAAGMAAYLQRDRLDRLKSLWPLTASPAVGAVRSATIRVTPDQSLAAAIASADAGMDIIVDPGE